MADTNETIADIIAWLRRPREGENAYLTAWRDEIADRLEAAHKREKAAIEADALAIGGMVEAARKRELSKNASKNWADFGQLGDAAAMREALVKCVNLIIEFGNAEIVKTPLDVIIDIESILTAALASPATAEKSSAVGDCAKLREALTTIQKIIKSYGDNQPQFALTLISEAVYAALSAPPRNCKKEVENDD